MGIFLETKIPLIYINPFGQAEAEDHEITHAENATIDTALRKVSRIIQRTLWGERVRNRPAENNIVKGRIYSLLSRKANRQDRETVVQDVMKVLNEGVWQNALSMAKDEVLADFAARSSFRNMPSLLAYTFDPTGPQPDSDAKRRKQLDSYQYLARAGIEKNIFSANNFRQEYDEIVKEYNQTVQSNVESVASIWTVVQQLDNRDHWQRTLLAFMRQNPISTWKSQAKLVFSETVSQAKERIFAHEKRKQAIWAEINKLEGLKQNIKNPQYQALIARNEDIPEAQEILKQITDFIESIKPHINLSMQELTADLVTNDQAASRVMQQLLTPRIEKLNSEVAKRIDQLIAQHPLTLLQNNLRRLTELDTGSTHLQQISNIEYSLVRNLLSKLDDLIGGNTTVRTTFTNLIYEKCLYDDAISAEQMRSKLDDVWSYRNRTVEERNSQIEQAVTIVQQFEHIFAIIREVRSTINKQYQDKVKFRDLATKIAEIREQLRDKMYLSELDRLEEIQSFIPPSDLAVAENISLILESSKESSASIQKQLEKLKEDISTAVASTN